MGLDDGERRATSAGYSHVQARTNRAQGVPIALAPRPAQGHSAEKERLEGALSAHFDLVWRTLRRFGVPASMADDAAQHVFLTLAARLQEVTLDKQRAFLIGASIRVAANARRRRQRTPDSLHESDPVDAEGLSPEELLDWKQRVEALDRALEALTDDHRTVFVLYEIEGFSLPEVAETLDIPLGTATSRLRRARLSFEAWVTAKQQTGELA